jgi:hypothetical protein
MSPQSLPDGDPAAIRRYFHGSLEGYDLETLRAVVKDLIEHQGNQAGGRCLKTCTPASRRHLELASENRPLARHVARRSASTHHVETGVRP